jgi:acetyltransferase-like isoleucine patch superfamily enzyme
MKKIFWKIEDLNWNLRCRYHLWLHGPYGLSKVVEQMPFRYIVKYLRKYGATIGEHCRFERGLNIHRPLGKKPFENLFIGDHVYLGHETLIDLSRKVVIRDRVIFASRCQVWTHASYYGKPDCKDPQYGETFGEIRIEEGALIYSGAILTHGITLGSFCRVGANSLVNRSVEPGNFVGGVPIRVIPSIKNQ